MHTQNIDIEQIRTKITTIFYSDVQDLTQKRKYLRITQSEMAFYCEVSLRTIQNFESFECMNYKTLSIYKEIFNK